MKPQSGYGIGWYIEVAENDLYVVHRSGGTVGVSTVLALVPEEALSPSVQTTERQAAPHLLGCTSPRCTVAEASPALAVQ